MKRRFPPVLPTRRLRGGTWAWGLALATSGAIFGAGCSEDRATPAAAPAFDGDVAALLALRCASCHQGASPPGGWRATSYLDAIACVAPGATPATLPADARAPVLRVLDTPSHAAILSPDERASLLAWVASGTPASAGTVHTPSFADPRATDFHGAKLRAARWAPMLDPSDPEACGRCHEGAPSRPSGITHAAPGAPACTSCHDEPGGALACGTCHGRRENPAPPRDLCFFPDDAKHAGAHAAHTDPGRRSVFACSTCHPAPGAAVVSGLHANGAVEVVFDTKRVVPEASYDTTSSACAVACHDRGGARPRPRWSETGPMACGDCHGSPPRDHFPGPCTTCHREANAQGTALAAGALHMNGRVDLGDGSGRCGACHGSGDDPWPKTAAHAAHRDPTLTDPVACSDCHVVPTSLDSPGHMNGVVEVRFSGRAVARGAAPSWDGQACANVACHGAKMPDAPAVVPAWRDTSGAARACGACHGIPPSQHTASTSCDRAGCHGAEVTRDASGVLGISSSGRTLHVNGVFDN